MYWAFLPCMAMADKAEKGSLELAMFWDTPDTPRVSGVDFYFFNL